MSDLIADVGLAELNALIAAGEQNEPWILDHGQSILGAGEGSIASALEAGFRAKVPIAGGAIAKAIGAAVAQLETEQNVSIKGAFDATIARLKAAAAPPK